MPAIPPPPPKKTSKNHQSIEHNIVNMGTSNPLMQASECMPVVSRITQLVNNCSVITFVPGGGDW